MGDFDNMRNYFETVQFCVMVNSNIISHIAGLGVDSFGSNIENFDIMWNETSVFCYLVIHTFRVSFDFTAILWLWYNTTIFFVFVRDNYSTTRQSTRILVA